MFFYRVKNFLLLVKTHWLIIITALFLVFLIELPTLSFPFIIGDAYRGINIPISGANVHEYLVRGKEILEGHGLGSSTLREGKENEDYYFSISEYILVKPAIWLGFSSADITTIYVVDNFIGVFILILLIYSLVFQMSGGSKTLSAMTALFVIGGYSIVYNKSLFYNDFNMYGRATVPYIPSIFFFLYLNLLYKSLTSPKKKFIILSGIAFGLLFYIYFFAWTFSLAATATLLVLYLFRKDIRSAKKVLMILALGLLFGAYNLFRIFSFVNSPAGQNFSYYSWLMHTRSAVFSKIGFVTLILFIVFAFKRRADKNLVFILSLILAGWIALNQQLFTGKLLQYGHYYWYLIVPMSIVSGFYMFWFWLDSDRLRRVLFVLILAAVFLNTMVGQYRSALTGIDFKLYQQNFRPLIDYLETAPVQGVILATDEINETLFTIYTSHDLFWSSFALLDKTHPQRVRDALFVYAYLNKYSRDNFYDYFNKIIRNPDSDSFYKSLYFSIEGRASGLDFYIYMSTVANDPTILEDRRQKILMALSEEYNTILKNGGVISLLKRYGVNFIFWDKNRNPEWDLSVLPDLKLVVENKQIYLYKLGVDSIN